MKTAPTIKLAILFSAVIWVLSSGARAFDDRIVLIKNNEVITGHVKHDELNGVEIDVKEKTGQFVARKLMPNEIVSIDFDVPNSEFRSAVQAYKGGSYGQAAGDLSSLMSDKDVYGPLRAEVKPFIAYLYAECRFLGGKVSEALPAYEKFMDDYKTSRYFPKAASRRLDVALMSKDYAKVAPILGQLRGLGGEYSALADYYEGKSLLLQGDTKKAEGKFSSAAGAPSNEIKAMALMGQADCAAAEKNLAKSRELAEKVLLIPNTKMAGAAHLAIGDALFAEGEKLSGEALAAKLQEAVLEYMRVILEYSGDPSTEPHALFKAGESLQRISEKGNRGPNKAEDHSRAMALYTKLISDPRFKETAWAKQAAENMRNFK